MHALPTVLPSRDNLKRHLLVLAAIGTLALASVVFPTVPALADPPCPDPSGYCPNGGQAPVQNPTGGNVPVQNPSGGNVPAQNASGGNAPVQNPQTNNAATDVAVDVSTNEAAPGDTVLFTGQGFAANGKGGDIFVNLVYPDGTRLDTRSVPFTCSTTPDGQLIYGPDGEPVCSSGAAGQRIQSDATGVFLGAVTIPANAPAGDAQLCTNSIFSKPACAPITID